MYRISLQYSNASIVICVICVWFSLQNLEYLISDLLFDRSKSMNYASFGLKNDLHVFYCNWSMNIQTSTLVAQGQMHWLSLTMMQNG